MKTVTANGTKGCLIYSQVEDRFLFRVYDKEHNFKDYNILHCDLGIVVDDVDAYFYEKEDGRLLLDHSPETLGLRND